MIKVKTLDYYDRAAAYLDRSKEDSLGENARRLFPYYS